MNDFKDKIINFLSVSGVSILKALLVFVIGIFAIKFISKFLTKILNKSKLNKLTTNFILTTEKVVIYILFALLVLQTLGVSITGIIAVLSTAGLAIGLALKDSLTNLASGIILVANQEFKEGDYISINNTEGTVCEIKLFTTTISTIDNKVIIIPNSNMINYALTNYSTRQIRRVEFNFVVSHSVDYLLCKSLIISALQQGENLVDYKRPFVSVFSIDEKGINIFAYIWCDNEKYWDNYYLIQEKVLDLFQKNKIARPNTIIEIKNKTNHSFLTKNDKNK